MKKLRNAIAMLLALVMVISCMGMAAAAPQSAEFQAKTRQESASSAKKEMKGFQSLSFQQNLYQYADDEQVRAIVVLEDKPVADLTSRGAKNEAALRTQVQKGQSEVHAALRGVNYQVKYSYNTLLNGFSCDVAYGDLEKLAAAPGVDAVYIANRYAKPVMDKADASPMMHNSNYMTGIYEALNGEFDGTGTVIAVLDTGITPDHEAFADADGWCAEYGRLTEEDVARAAAPGQYINAKIPFAYDYAEMDNDPTDYDGHGTHVSGIAAGCTYSEDGGYTFIGAAPGAQLLAMKIFMDDTGGTTSDIYFYALEDAFRMGADVVNMSIGAQNGFTYDAELETFVFGNIYKRMEASGVVMAVAAGNEYSMADFSSLGYIGPEYQDYGTVASPSTYDGNTSVASVENFAFPSLVLKTDAGSFSYIDSSPDGMWLENFGGNEPVEYVILPNPANAADISLGYAEDYEGVDVSGKIVVVKRGELSFEEKVEFAADAGAIGCIVGNNEPGLISMSIETFEIPAVSIQVQDVQALIDAEQYLLASPLELEDVMNPNGLLMSDFSNWGTSPMLTLDPAITSVGGYVYSAVPGGTDTYEVYSGTSMASPNYAGTVATVLGFLEQEGAKYDLETNEWFGLTKEDRAERANALLESTAILLTDAYGWLYSPRKQGAGLANAALAITTYYDSAYIANPLQELGDDADKTGFYTFDLTVVNEGYSTANLVPETVLMYDYIYDYYEGTSDEPFYMNSIASQYIDDEDMTVRYLMDGQDVSQGFTVMEGDVLNLTVEIQLSEEIMAYFDEIFPNGNYVEGYVCFNSYSEARSVSSPLHATVLAYYGDWTQGQVLESEDFRDFIEINNYVGTEIVDDEGNTFADYGYTALDFMNSYTTPNFAYTASMVDGVPSNLVYYLGDNLIDYADYYESHNAFSTELSDGTWVYATGMYASPMQLRNARNLIMTVTDKDTGEVYMVDNTEYLPKAYYDAEYGWQATGAFYWDGTDAHGDYVPSGTKAVVTFEAVLPYTNENSPETEYDGTYVGEIWSYEVTVDYTAPVIESVDLDLETGILTVTASDDNHLASIYLANDYYDIMDAAVFSSDTAGESFTAQFDVNPLIEAGYATVRVTALDYATNEMEEIAYLFEEGDWAKITFNSPNGPTYRFAKTGDYLTIPECTDEVENCEFFLWTHTCQDVITDMELWFIDGMYFAGDELLVAGDMEFYALYAVGQCEPLEKVNYYAMWPDFDDFAGEWAIVGMGVDDYGDLDVTNPIAMNGEAEAITVADLEDAEIGDWYIEFYTNEPCVHFNLTAVGEGVYTIQHNETGKYLSLDGEALTMVDAVTDEAQWNVTCDPDDNLWELAAMVTNAANPEMHLVYDEDEGVFAAYEDPQDYMLYLFTRVDSELIISHYSTTLQNELPDYMDGFTDTPADWYADAINFVVHQGIMNGTGETTFNPEGTMTRAMMATVLYRLCGEPIVDEPSTFTDVPEDQWYSMAVAWAQDEGIVNGVSETLFDPMGAITREQIAAILYRFMGEPEGQGDMSAFKDVEAISAYAVDAMSWAVEIGLFQGDAGYLKPRVPATRAEFACIIMRFLQD